MLLHFRSSFITFACYDNTIISRVIRLKKEKELTGKCSRKAKY